MADRPAAGVGAAGAEAPGRPGSDPHGEHCHTRAGGDHRCVGCEGGFPSPLPVAPYYPKNLYEFFHTTHQPAEIRGWLRDAAAYNDVPYDLAAAILQQENGPQATEVQKIKQFGERMLGAAAGYVDRFVPVPERAVENTAGIANMKRSTLMGGARYVKDVLGYPAIPAEVADRLFGKVDTQIPGADLRNDMYFFSAHLRQLIDRVTGQPGYSGSLSRDQVHDIARAYNGTGPLAEKYAVDAVNRFDRAVAGKTRLYFYQKP